MLALVTGAGGFIGGHLVKRLIRDGFAVHGVDVKPLKEWWQISPTAFNWDCVDLRSTFTRGRFAPYHFDHIYHLACDVAGMGYTSKHSSMGIGNVQMSANVLEFAIRNKSRLYFASSACVYPDQEGDCRESDAFPANCSADGYGWEKFYTEKMCEFAYKEHGTETRFGRFHNVYGPHGTFEGGREKAPAAMIRKVMEVVMRREKAVEIWGDGEQTRSFTYVEDAVEGVRRLMDSDCRQAVNIGSTERVTVNYLCDVAQRACGTTVPVKHVDSDTLGVRNRNSQNDLIKEVLGWEPRITLEEGMIPTANWIMGMMV